MTPSDASPSRIPLSRVEIDDEIRERVIAAVDSGRYILGPESRAFEAELAASVGTAHAVLTSSATAGLMLALTGLGVGDGDEVLVPSHTAFPTVEAIFRAGARPVFLDVGRDYTLDPEWIEPRITARTRAILPVHLYGQACDMDPILEIAKRHGLVVLEDCAQAQGGAHRGRRLGSLGDAGVLSFYASKNLTVLGDGGAVVTDDAALAARLRMLRDHGRSEKYVHALVGWNLRFNDIQAAAGRVLLRRLDAMNETRRARVARYRERLAGLPLELPVEVKWAHHVYHLFVVACDERDALQRHLAAHGVETGIHYPVPCHRQPATLAQPHLRSEALPATERACERILSLPLFPAMTEAEVDRVADTVRGFFEADATHRA